MSRRRGFTLIELLVVIAIIGILAAMLFPVFARARESARKTQCLANVKNIATAINMYLTDYERTWPNETNRQVIDYFNTGPGGSGDVFTYPDVCNNARQANPYLRDAVILEDYVKSVDVWKCPSARIMSGARFICPVGRDGFWLNAYIDHQGEWGAAGGYEYGGPCDLAFPPGWGGDVTDSFTQHRAATTEGWGPAGAEAGVFVQGVGVNDSLHWQNMSAVQDAGRYIACGDTGAAILIWNANRLAYPDTCHLSFCGGTASGTGCPGTCDADWENCPGSELCGFDDSQSARFWTDPNYQKTFTRHMGGSNVGFLDGHAKWFLANTIMTQSEPFPDAYFEGGLCACWPGNGVMY